MEAASELIADAASEIEGGARPAGGQIPAKLPTFYINRASDTERRDAIRGYLRLAQLSAERVAGVEGYAVPAPFRDMFFTEGQLHSTLRPGEVGCYASHLATMRLLVERNLPYALILEDDAELPVDLHVILADVLASLPDGWDIVHLSRDSNRAIKPVADLGDGRRIVRYSRVPEVTTGYLVSRSGAEKFLNPVKRYWPVDTDFRQPWRFGLNIYGVAPSIIVAGGSLGSAIHDLGSHSRQRRGLPIPSRHCWTGNPLHTPEGIVFNFRALGPHAWAVCNVYNSMRRVVSALKLRPLLRWLQMEGVGSRLVGRLAPVRADRR
jgi:glycosyl transferase family 25